MILYFPTPIYNQYSPDKKIQWILVMLLDMQNWLQCSWDNILPNSVDNLQVFLSHIYLVVCRINPNVN